MEFEEALHKASSFMKKYKGYFLCSVFSSIKKITREDTTSLLR